MQPNDKNYQRLIIESMVSRLPDDKLEAVLSFIESCIDKNEKKIVPFKGIWKGIGFEGLDLEAEIKSVRQSSLEDLEKEINS